jgi:hypothetical protein
MQMLLKVVLDTIFGVFLKTAVQKALVQSISLIATSCECRVNFLYQEIRNTEKQNSLQEILDQ